MREEVGRVRRRPLSFRPHARLRGSRDFDRVHQGGARVPTRDLTVIVRVSALPHPRLGMAVGRKVGGAVVRNRLRRRIRELVRLNQAELVGLDIVVVARPTAAILNALPFGALGNLLLSAIRQAAQRARRSAPRGAP